MKDQKEFQVTKPMENFVSDVIAMEEEEAKQAGMLGYMARIVVQASMPYKKVKGNEYKRKNGNYKLVMFAPSDIGLPYGTIPRIVISWMTTEAVKTMSRELFLGNTLNDFLYELGMVPSGGRWGSTTRVKDQIKRMSGSHISCFYDDKDSFSLDSMKLIKKANLWWSPKDPNQGSLFDSTLTLEEEFFKEITSNPIPVDLRALKSLSKSPMAIDIYNWLTYRMSYLKQNTNIPFESLQVQFGGEYKTDRFGRSNFKKEFLKQLKKVHMVYKKANIEEFDKGIILKPSKSHIISTVK